MINSLFLQYSWEKKKKKTLTLKTDKNIIKVHHHIIQTVSAVRTRRVNPRKDITMIRPQIGFKCGELQWQKIIRGWGVVVLVVVIGMVIVGHLLIIIWDLFLLFYQGEWWEKGVAIILIVWFKAEQNGRISCSRIFHHNLRWLQHAFACVLAVVCGFVHWGLLFSHLDLFGCHAALVMLVGAPIVASAQNKTQGVILECFCYFSIPLIFNITIWLRNYCKMFDYEGWSKRYRQSCDGFSMKDECEPFGWCLLDNRKEMIVGVTW